MVQLARIDTGAVVVELAGVSEYPVALQSRVAGGITPHFAVSLNSSPIPTEEAPVLFEERNYEIIARATEPGVQPAVAFRDPTLVLQQTVVPEAGLVAITVRFRGQVGRTSFSVRAGDSTLVIEAEIYPSKIDYFEDYEELLSDVSRVHRALTLEYLRATFRQGRLDRDETGTGIEWLSLLRQQVDELRGAIQYINAAPRRTLVRESVSSPLHRVRGSNSSVLRVVARGLGIGGSQQVPGIGSVREHIQVPLSYESLDTQEHRWIRSRLKAVLARLTELEAEQQQRMDRSAKRSGKQPPRLAAELAEISSLKDDIGRLLETPVIAAATLDVPLLAATIQLQAAIGYGQAYRVLTTLNAALVRAAGSQEYSTSDLNELYETWCFLKVAQVVAELLGTDVDYSELVPTDGAGLRFALRKGLTRSVKLSGKYVRAALVYNPSFEVPTGVQKPDIVLRVAASGGLDAFVILDAKYRIDASTEYIRQFGAIGAPVEAVNQLHRYRDAIQVVDDQGEVVRPVIAGVALFPWPEPAVDYELLEAADEIGIGALPFLPGNDLDLREWLTGVFASLGLSVIGPDGRRLRLIR